MSSKQIDMKKLLKLIIEEQGNLAKTKDKEAIFIFGNTGAGKSSLISFLIGFDFQSIKRKCVRINNLEIKAPQIGYDVVTCTLVPDAYYHELSNGNGIYFIDTAGFADTQGPTEGLFTEIALQIALMYPSAIKAVIAVVEEAQIQTLRGSIFTKVAQKLFSICQGSEFHDSFFLFVTKPWSEEDQLIETFEELKIEFGKAAAIMAAKGPSKASQAQRFSQVEGIIQVFLETKNIAIVNPYKDESRKKIIKMLSNSKPIPKSCIGRGMNFNIQNELNNILSHIALQEPGKFSEIQILLKSILYQKQSRQVLQC